MRKITYGDAVQTYTGRGEITFPLGGRIQSYFAMTEYKTGRWILTCEGRFAKESYPSWERLVHQYRLDPSQSLEAAQKNGLVERFVGRTEDDRQLTIGQMFLVSAQATGLALTQKNLTLQMQFDCHHVSLAPAPVVP